MIQRFTQLINSYPSSGRSESTFPWRATGYQASEAGKNGDKSGVRPSDLAQQVIMDNESEGA